MDIMNVLCNLPEEVQKEVVIKLINYYYLGVDKKAYPCVMHWMKECWGKKLKDVLQYIDYIE